MFFEGFPMFTSWWYQIEKKVVSINFNRVFQFLQLELPEKFFFQKTLLEDITIVPNFYHKK